MHSDADIRNRLQSAGLGELVERVLDATTNEIRITATRAVSFSLGQSRFGGTPDLPPETRWPRQRWTRDDVARWPVFARDELDEAVAAGVVVAEADHFALALPFVAQLDLAVLAPFQSLLPRHGHLWLFADQSTTLGEIEGYPHCACVCLYAQDTELVRVNAPPVSETLPELALAFTSGPSLPDADALDLRGEAWDRYSHAVHPLLQPEPRHASLSRAQYGSIAWVPPAGYITLLRVDSDYGLDVPLNWGDAAWITFAVPETSLARCDFSAVRAFRWVG